MKNKPLMLVLTSAAVLLFGSAAQPLSAQLAVPPPMPAYQPFSDQQLDQMLGPIALYPDPRLGEVLQAATFPVQIVLANRYVTSGGDPNLIYQQPWDASIQALARYPSILQYMDNNLDWTTQLGQAFLNQQQQVMDSIQRLRRSAENFGNLQSTPQQEVVDYGGDIEILPPEPDVVYVPIYQPSYVYCRSGFGPAFGFGASIGPWLDCDFDWRQHHLCFWNREHERPTGWWHERPGWRRDWMAHRDADWRQEDHRGFETARHGDRNWEHPNDRDWNRPEDRGGNHSTISDHQPHNDAVIWMSRSGATPRQTATPRPAAVRQSGAIFVANPPVSMPHPAQNGGAFGGERSYDVRNFGNRGHDTMPTITRPEPIRSEPVHFDTSRSAPPVSHPAPLFQGGGGSGGGSHSSGSQSRH